MVCATESPATSAARRSAMSMPAETPAPVMTLPSRTIRSPTGSAPKSRRAPRAAQCVVARRPRSSPAAPSTRAPVHTDVVQVVVACAFVSHSITTGSVITGRMFIPPGTRMMSGRGTAASACSASRATPASVRLRPGALATGNTSAPGSADSTCKGPMASSAVMPSKRRSAVFMVSSLTRAPEVGAVVPGRDAQGSAERPVHGLDGAEAGVAGDLGQPGAGGLEPPARRLDPRALDVDRRGEPQITPKRAGEVARAHPRAARERGHRQVLGRVVGDEGLEVAERVTLGELPAELGAELRLPARPAQEQDEPARDFEGDSSPEVFIHQIQGEIDAGGHAGGRAHRAFPDEDRVLLHANARVATGQLVAGRPVRGGAAAIQEARLGKEEGARADRGDTARSASGSADPAHEGAIARGLLDAGAARHDQGVDRTRGV